jgi:hypothetical protein
MKITLEAILRSLSHETLSFMSDSGHGNGTIEPEQIPKVIGRINAILRRLSVKFVLNEKTVKVNVVADRLYYPLTALNAAWVVADLANPWTADVGRILGIKTPSGRMYDLSDRSTHDSIMLDTEGTGFRFPYFFAEGEYEIIYKASTPQFEESPEPDLSEELSIPEALLNALYQGVAAMTYEGIGGSENIALANSKWAMFNSDCSDAKINSSVEVEEYLDVNLFANRGFK